MDTRKVSFFPPPSTLKILFHIFIHCCYWSHYRHQISNCLFSLGFIFGFWCSSLITIFLGVNFLWFKLLGVSKFMSSINSLSIRTLLLHSVYSLSLRFKSCIYSLSFSNLWVHMNHLGSLLTNAHSNSRIH